MFLDLDSGAQTIPFQENTSASPGLFTLPLSRSLSTRTFFFYLAVKILFFKEFFLHEGSSSYSSQTP